MSQIWGDSNKDFSAELTQDRHFPKTKCYENGELAKEKFF